MINPGPNTVLAKGDHLLLLGLPDQIRRAREFLASVQ